MSTKPISHSKPSLGNAEAQAASRVIASGNVAQGPEVAAFEAECAARLGRKFGVAVSSGTAGLHLTLAALGAEADSAVVYPAYACAALRTAVDLAGAQSRMCDVGGNFNLSPNAACDDAFGAIVPHLFGAEAKLPKHGHVIEDIAQSIGADFGGGTIASVASFYATKMITSGEGGMVLTDDEDLAKKLRSRRAYDKRSDYQKRYNYKMTDIQAAIGRVQLTRLDEFIERRRAIAAKYSEAFQVFPLDLPQGEGHVYYRYVVSLDDREALDKHLNDAGIEAKRPVFQPAHHGMQNAGEFPGADRAHARALSLPIYPDLDDASIARVISCVTSFFG